MTPPRVRSILAGTALLGLASALWAHDLFIKLDSYFLAPGTAVEVPVINGTFTSSENPIERRRIADLSVVTPGGREAIDTNAVSARGDSSFVSLRLAGPGTYLIGMSTRPSMIALSGEQFTAYLREEAIRDVLDARTRAGVSGDSAWERYSKHVKAVFQVGATRSGGFAEPLGYPAELVPLDNPYRLGPGGVLRVRCLVDGRPVPGLSVLAGGRTPKGARIRPAVLRSDADGIVAVRLAARGKWYVKFVRMVERGGRPNYESRWATLTFEVR